ncbi:MAG TPA: DUF5701 family protein [Dermatophilaceae bacterium]|nr:DUF5701 family protein [Dermatophilaceae bacterium]
MPATAVLVTTAAAELDRQVATLLDLGYPALAGLTTSAFRDLLDPLRPVAAGLGDLPAAAPGHAPVILVVTRDLVAPEDTVPLLRLPVRGRQAAPPGVVDRNHEPGSLATYAPLDVLAIPEHPAYLLLDVDRGEEFRDVRPEDALPVVLRRGRTPLTIDEGVALVTHAPHLLERNRCFMLAGSRRADRRVPAMWISGRAPKLGWCWDGNPHSWLGLASAGARRGRGPILPG